MKSYELTTNLSHSGQKFSRGDILDENDLPKEVVKHLVATGGLVEYKPKRKEVDEDAATANGIIADARKRAAEIVANAKATAKEIVKNAKDQTSASENEEAPKQESKK